MSDIAQYLAGLTEPWRRCLELAWESFTEGSMPVGSVLTNAEGTIVAEGRNRSFGGAVAGRLAGSFIAHAEINALAQLPPGEYGTSCLWSSLEPCFMCSSAAAHSHVGQVRFAAADPLMEGVERLPELNPWMERRWARRNGPAEEPLAALAALLHLVWNVERRPDGVVARRYETADPGLLGIARDLIGSQQLRSAPDLGAAAAIIGSALSTR